MKFILSLIALIGGVLAAGKIFVWGDSVVGYGSYVPWGLWVAVYGFLVTLSAGAALVANLYYGFGLERYKKASRPAMVIALFSLLVALPLIASDLGHPIRGLMVLLRPNLFAFLPWAVWSYIAFWVVSLFLLKKEKSGQSTAFLGKLSMLLAIIFLIIESLHFGVIIAHSVWNSAIIIPLFFLTALSLGFATVVLFNGTTKDPLLRGILSALLILLGLIVIGQVVVHAYSSAPEMADAALHTLQSFAFWIYVLFGLLVPICLFALSSNPLFAKIGAFSVLVGLLADKYDFITGAFASAQFSELPAAYHGPGLTLLYMPTLIEVIVAIGFLAAIPAFFLWFSSQLELKN